MRIGVLGGTFDPPHNGHLLVGRAAQRQLGLDRVLWVPAGVQPLKQDRRVSPPEVRAEMVRRAIVDEPGFEMSRIDLDRPGPHYSADLLRIVSGIYPGAELWFILGVDSLRDLLRWRDPQALIELARLAVVSRSGSEPDWPALEAALPGLRERIDWIESPPVDVSGVDIRRRAREGLPIEDWVPAAVARYIAEYRLYV